MRLRHRHLLLSLSAAAVGVGLLAVARHTGSNARHPAASGATIRAKVVSKPPPGATVVEASSALDDLPVARALVEWAAHTNEQDEWIGDVVEGEAGRGVVETLHRKLPHYRAPNRADAHHDGVYVACEGRVVVITAAGWALAPEAR